jgi:hypothetical protein
MDSCSSATRTNKRRFPLLVQGAENIRLICFFVLVLLSFSGTRTRYEPGEYEYHFIEYEYD